MLCISSQLVMLWWLRKIADTMKDLRILDVEGHLPAPYRNANDKELSPARGFDCVRHATSIIAAFIASILTPFFDPREVQVSRFNPLQRGAIMDFRVSYFLKLLKNVLSFFAFRKCRHKKNVRPPAPAFLARQFLLLSFVVPCESGMASLVWPAVKQ